MAQTSSIGAKPYLNHTSVIILNEQVVKQKFNETINYLLHDVRIRSACIVMITKEQTTKENVYIPYRTSTNEEVDGILFESK